GTGSLSLGATGFMVRRLLSRLIPPGVFGSEPFDGDRDAGSRPGRTGAGARLAPPEAPCLPAGRRLYAVGDVHGRFDLLQALLAQVRQDAASAPAGTAVTLLFLGDYVDRGLQSREVLELLSGDPWPGVECVFLRGNHDEMMRHFLEVPESGRLWFDLGGAATLYSYGVGLAGGGAAIPTEAAAWADLAARLAEALPAAHRRFLDATRLTYEAGDYLFVHAGLRPGVPLEQQDPDDLTTIREPFLSAPTGCGRVVVHGHTPVRAPAVTPHRIGVDTGA